MSQLPVCNHSEGQHRRKENYFNISAAPPAEKPGECPAVPPGTVGTCVEMCSNDDDCSDDKKCCSNGCGHVCLKREWNYSRVVHIRLW